jgi:hypothetical protein
LEEGVPLVVLRVNSKRRKYDTLSGTCLTTLSGIQERNEPYREIHRPKGTTVPDKTNSSVHYNKHRFITRNTRKHKEVKDKAIFVEQKD